MELVVYVREGCPHCEKVLRAVEGCAELHARGARILLVPELAGPLIRGSQSPPPLAERFGPHGALVPQVVVRGRVGGRVLELVLVGAPRSEEEFCKALALLASSLA
ncbi:MAG: hypothetical protein QXZ31_08355 [Thermofilaceae archaeon]